MEEIENEKNCIVINSHYDVYVLDRCFYILFI
jgi:hypothetical protein